MSLENGGRELVLAWEDGGTIRIGAETLWGQCPSALGRARRARGIFTSGDPGLRITCVKPIGNYALNLSFSDGHDRGVYPWQLLGELSQRPGLDQFITPRPLCDDGRPAQRKNGGQG
jgi:DUF971 family protein